MTNKTRVITRNAAAVCTSLAHRHRKGRLLLTVSPLFRWTVANGIKILVGQIKIMKSKCAEEKDGKSFLHFWRRANFLTFVVFLLLIRRLAIKEKEREREREKEKTEIHCQCRTPPPSPPTLTPPQPPLTINRQKTKRKSKQRSASWLMCWDWPIRPKWNAESPRLGKSQAFIHFGDFSTFKEQKSTKLAIACEMEHFRICWAAWCGNVSGFNSFASEIENCFIQNNVRSHIG